MLLVRLCSYEAIRTAGPVKAGVMPLMCYEPWFAPPKQKQKNLFGQALEDPS